MKRKVLLLGIAAGRIKACRNWDSGSWRYGATLTGDVGHQVQADLDLVRCGAKTRSQLAGEYNNDFRQVMEKNGAEIVSINDTAENEWVLNTFSRFGGSKDAVTSTATS